MYLNLLDNQICSFSAVKANMTLQPFMVQGPVFFQLGILYRNIVLLEKIV